MTAVDVDALDAAREAATPGPWVLAEWSDATILAQRYLDSLNAGEPEDQRPAFLHTTASNAADAALIVAAVNALPDLLAEVRRGRALRERLEGLAEEDDAIRDDYGYRIRNGLDPSPGDRIRAALAAVDAS